MAGRVPVRRHLRRRVLAAHTITAEVPESRLLPRGRIPEYDRKGQMFGIDKALGDDQYVFLLVEDVYEMGGVYNDAYLFDAERLIREGARWRSQDVLLLPEAFAFREAVVKWLKGLSDKEWWGDFAWDFDAPASDEDGEEEILDIDEWFAWNKVNERQLRTAINKSPKVKRAWDRLVAARDRITLSGDEAVAGIRRCIKRKEQSDFVRTPGCGEILVPRSLPLGESVGVVVVR